MGRRRRRQNETKQKPFDIQVWIRMDAAREAGREEEAIKQRNELVSGNRPQAVKVAHDFSQRIARGSCDQHDLIQASCVGLTRAVWNFNPRASKTYKLEEFDPMKGAFMGYAVKYCFAEQWKTFRKDRVVYKPLSEDVAVRFKDAYREQVAAGKTPTEASLGLPKGMKVARVARACEPAPGLDFLGATTTSDEEWRAVRALNEHNHVDSAEDHLLREEEAQGQEKLLSRLDRKTRIAVEGVVMHEQTLLSVARKLGIKSAEVKELVAQGLADLKRMAHA